MSNLISDFLNNRLKPVRTGGLVNGALDLELPSDSENESEAGDSTDSETEKYVTEEMNKYFSESKLLRGLNDVVDMEEESIVGSELTSTEVPQAFYKYNFNTIFRNKLPIDSFKDKIIELINTNSVVIIHGPTGCGKTTQVPQYILDECRSRKQRCDIIVTQPRRIAAINIAQRVCQERAWSLGGVCGYQVGLNKNAGEDVILTYVTTEVLLQKLIMHKNLNRFTHVIIDEVHERNKNMDFLLLVVRKFLFTNSPNVKVILMSATMHAEEFANYFGSISKGKEGGDGIPISAPILNVNKKSEFHTNIYHLEQLRPILTGSMPLFNINSPGIDALSYQLCLSLIRYMNKFDETDPKTNQKIIGSVLVFLPGYFEIEEMHKLLSADEGISTWDVIPMHSSLTNEVLSKAFEKPRPGIRKIILSTNIAESSLTVPDVTYVIDFCLTKQMTVNPTTKFCTLALEWASHNNCTQRAGRVGRVANGKVYRLVPVDFYNNEMPPNTLPEILRAPLENIILFMKMLELNDTPKHVLSLALSPPNLKEVETCVWRLKEAGGLLRTCRGKESVSDGDLTFLGEVMGNLPVDVNLSKLIILGHMFCCLEETVIMAAGCTTRNLFVRSFNERLHSYRKKLIWADGACSDLIAMVNLYNVWVRATLQHRFRNKAEEVSWCRTHFINYKALMEWDILIKELHRRLNTKFNIKPHDAGKNIMMKRDERSMVLKVVICGAFYPNYFIRSSDYGQVDIKEAVKTLSGRDPFNTVYFTNMKANHPGKIYVRAIKKMIGATGNVHVACEPGSSKIFVEFKDKPQLETVTVDGRPYVTNVSNNIVMDVYEAVKKRLLRMRFDLQILSDAKALEFANEMETKYKQIQMFEEQNRGALLDYNPFPTLDSQYMKLVVCHVVDAGHFYVHNSALDTTQDNLKMIFRALNESQVMLKRNTDQIKLHDQLYAARFHSDKKFYRCRVTGINDNHAMIFFVDYGNTQTVKPQDLYQLPMTDELMLPPMALCCVLSEIRPSLKLNSKGLWTEEATEMFSQKTLGIMLYAKVYSVVADVIHLELFKSVDSGRQARNESMNEFLVKSGYAEKCPESFLSKMDHGRRVQVQASQDPVNEAARVWVAPPVGYSDYESPQMTGLRYTVELKGPYSPLEMRVCGILEATSGLDVKIESDSVNSVLLDDSPEDPHARLVVAASVSQSASGTCLVLNQTTVTPSMAGFPKLMLMLFAPMMEPKTNDEGTRITSILCGLGYKDGSNKSQFPAHDISYPLDTELTDDLISKVNELRYLMNKAIKTMDNIKRENEFPSEMFQHQKYLKDCLISLLRWEFKSCTRVEGKFANIWKKSACDDLEILRMNTGEDKEDIWPLHWFLRLNVKEHQNIEMDANLEKLIQMSKNLIPIEEIVCELCQSERLTTISDIRIHVFKESHRQKYAEYKA